MSDTLIAILGLAGTLLSGTISFTLGKRWERKHQSLIIRAQMLEPIEEWLSGAERMVGIFGDTLSSVAIHSPGPLTYSLEERRKSTQFMVEKTNVVLGILQSGSLKTCRTRRIVPRLVEIIQTLDKHIKHTLLALDHEVLESAGKGILTQELLIKAGATKLKLEKDIQAAYSLIAEMKTVFT